MEHICSDYLFSNKVSENMMKQVNSVNHEEYQYLNLLKNILNNGHWENGRNGKVKSLFGDSMRFSLKDGQIPILTTKKVAWKTCLKELLWFIKGDRNNKFLDLFSYKMGVLNEKMCKEDKEFDQLQYIIDQLKNPETRNNRRLVMSAWNPNQLSEIVLPPCHVMCQFNVHDGNKLSCMIVQLSSDCILGQPFNIASYSFLTHLIAKHCGLEPYEFIHFLGNCHIYDEHIEGAETQIKRIPYKFPTLEITTKREDINDYTISDFIIKDYISY